MLKMDFSSKIKEILNENAIGASKLAEMLDVPAATISHLLSGRNKPSLDFLQRLIKHFPTLDLYELMDLNEYNYFNTIQNTDLNNDNKLEKKTELEFTKNPDKEIKKIIIIYSDNTFEEIKKSK